MSLNQLKKQCTDLIEARAKATQGEWVMTFEDPEGFPTAFLDEDKTKDFTIEDMNFTDTAANSSAQIASALLECIEALETISNAETISGEITNPDFMKILSGHCLNKITKENK